MKWDRIGSPHEKPCSHCGECCMAVTCALGQALFLISKDAICPAIEIDENEFYYCGLISNTTKYASPLVGIDEWKIDLMHDVFVKLIGIGIGCTNGERLHKEHRIDKTLLDLVKETVDVKGL